MRTQPGTRRSYTSQPAASESRTIAASCGERRKGRDDEEEEDEDVGEVVAMDAKSGTVRWRECVSYMKAQGVAQLYELGAGKVLSGLVKRIEPELTGTALNGPADIEAFAKTL